MSSPLKKRTLLIGDILKGPTTPLEPETRNRSSSVKIPTPLTSLHNSASPVKRNLRTEAASDVMNLSFQEGFMNINTRPKAHTMVDNNFVTMPSEVYGKKSTYTHNDIEARAFRTTKRQFGIEGVRPKTVYDWPIPNGQPQISPEKRVKTPVIIRTDEANLRKLLQKVQRDEEQMKAQIHEQVEKVKEELFGEHEHSHQEFMQNMKLLTKTTHEIDVNHRFVMNKLSEKKVQDALNKANLSKLDLDPKELQAELDAEMEYLRETFKMEKVIIHEVDEQVKQKLKARGIKKRLKKHTIDEFGANTTYYFRKIMDRMIERGDFEGALMISSLNKIVAIGLEDIWTNYTIQLDLIKKNPHEDLMDEIQKSKFTIEQQRILLKKKEEDTNLLVSLLTKQLERAQEEKKFLEQMLKEKHANENPPPERFSPIFKRREDGTFQQIELEEALAEHEEKVRKANAPPPDAKSSNSEEDPDNDSENGADS